MSKVENITKELSYFLIIFHKNLRIPIENIRQQVWNKLSLFFFPSPPMEVNDRGCFDSQTLILLRKRLDNLNPLRKRVMIQFRPGNF